MQKQRGHSTVCKYNTNANTNTNKNTLSNTDTNTNTNYLITNTCKNTNANTNTNKNTKSNTDTNTNTNYLQIQIHVKTQMQIQKIQEYNEDIQRFANFISVNWLHAMMNPGHPDFVKSELPS